MFDEKWSKESFYLYDLSAKNAQNATHADCISGLRLFFLSYTEVL